MKDIDLFWRLIVALGGIIGLFEGLRIGLNKGKRIYNKWKEKEEVEHNV